MDIASVDIGGRQVGPNQPVFIIAEAGVNHNGNPDLARQLVDVAADAGADAVKFQTFKAERVVSAGAPKAEYQKLTTSADESQMKMLKGLELSSEAHHRLISYCRERNILFMSSAFDEQSVDLLDELNVPSFKIGSGEVTNIPFLEYVAKKSKPIILSTGMSFLSEVDEAVKAILGVGNRQLVLLHCVSNYPADPADANLRAMLTMAAAFQVPVGYSDHSLGVQVSLAAVALGAVVIEKHFTLDRAMGGPDHAASLDPSELKELISGIRTIERSLGNGTKQPARSEEGNRTIVRRSVATAVDIPAGTVIHANMVTALRPGNGIPPAQLGRVLGRRCKRDVESGQLLSWEDLG